MSSIPIIIDPQSDQYLFAAAAVVFASVAYSLLFPEKPRFPPTKKPYGVFDSNGILYNRASVGKLHGTMPGVTSAYDIMKQSCAKGGDALTAGKRKLLKRHWVDLNGKQVEKLELDNKFEFMTYNEFGVAMHELGAGMRAVADLKANDCIIIYAETAREWFLAAQGAYTQGLTVVTIYATLGEEGFTHGALQTKAKLVVADAKLLKVLANVFKQSGKQLKNLKKVVYIPDDPVTPDPVVAKQTTDAVALLRSGGIEVLTFDELRAKGKEAKLAPRPPAATDLAIIMYTSGTTGLPKGVKISHRSMVAVIGGMVEKMVGYGVDPASKAQETYLAYLPLAHIMEMVVEMQLLSIGARLAYGSPHTLTPTGVKLKTGTCQGDVRAACALLKTTGVRCVANS